STTRSSCPTWPSSGGPATPCWPRSGAAADRPSHNGRWHHAHLAPSMHLMHKNGFLAAAVVALVVGAMAVGPISGQQVRRIYIPISQRGVGSAPELELLSSATYLDDQGDLHVIGEIRNAAAWSQGAVQVGMTFL